MLTIKVTDLVSCEQRISAKGRIGREIGGTQRSVLLRELFAYTNSNVTSIIW